MEDHQGKVAEFSGDGGAFADGAVPALLVVVGQPLENRHLAVSRDPFAQYPGGYSSRHEVIWSRQQNNVASSVF